MSQGQNCFKVDSLGIPSRGHRARRSYSGACDVTFTRGGSLGTGSSAEARSWALSRVARNRAQHAMNGNPAHAFMWAIISHKRPQQVPKMKAFLGDVLWTHVTWHVPRSSAADYRLHGCGPNAGRPLSAELCHHQMARLLAHDTANRPA